MNASAPERLLPPRFPFDWASDWGEDRYGPWVAFRFKGVRQGLRWCPPGRFLMGSPETEPEREDDEVQHPVTLTRGYWLADTACTQAL
jgi:sulfatase modifying factor 1